MKRIPVVLLLTTLVVASSFATSQAAARIKHATRHAPSQVASGNSCAGVDPSKCPASCRHDGATAVAANTHH